MKAKVVNAAVVNAAVVNAAVVNSAVIDCSPGTAVFVKTPVVETAGLSTLLASLLPQSGTFDEQSTCLVNFPNL